jgi:NtrC-family two-component system response regulator AlgB
MGRCSGSAPRAGAFEALDRGRFDHVFLDLWLGPESAIALLPEILRRPA